MSCVVCKGIESSVLKDFVRDSQETKVCKCNACGHQQIEPIPTMNEAQEFYDEDLQAKNVFENIDVYDMRIKSRTDVLRRASFVEQYVGNKTKSKLLEVGTGYGFFMDEMKKRGYDIEGIEISSVRRQISKEISGCQIHNYNLMASVDDEMKEKFDIVAMFHVLEHIQEPDKFLKNVYALLKRDGVLIIEVPNADDHVLNFSAEYFNFFYQLAHVSYFTPKSLKLLLDMLNLRNAEFFGIQRYSVVNMMNWLINKEPQLDKPSYDSIKNLEWLDRYYKERLAQDLSSDTIIAVVKKV